MVVDPKNPDSPSRCLDFLSKLSDVTCMLPADRLSALHRFSMLTTVVERNPGQEDEDLSGQLERLLRIVNAFSADSTLCDYVIDALWDRCQAMKVILPGCLAQMMCCFC